MKQQIRFCRSFDSTRIAFAVPWLTALSSGRSLVRMEERDLAAAHGRSFEQYRRQVSMILPAPRKSERTYTRPV